MKLYLEIGALFEDQWTGIPAVVAALAQSALSDASMDWTFIYETMLVPRAVVERMLIERSGRTARRTVQDAIWQATYLGYREAAEGTALFTNIKPMRGRFGREAMVVYDLSPLLTPQFHHQDTIDHFGNRFRSDVESSCHFFPISEATRGDLEAYFGVSRSACTVLPMGVDIDLMSLSLAQEIARSAVVEPYVVVLGTLEPRKNGRIVLEYIARNPGFALRNKVVFIGREGWLNERERLMEKIRNSCVPEERIVFTGYISEQEKICLLYNAAFCIYASHFEGYGLPILEATLLGKLVVSSKTSSMPEVAPEQCFFFDPNSVVDLARAISFAEKRYAQTRSALALPDVVERLSQHSWDHCYQGIRAWAAA